MVLQSTVFCRGKGNNKESGWPRTFQDSDQIPSCYPELQHPLAHFLFHFAGFQITQVHSFFTSPSNTLQEHKKNPGWSIYWPAVANLLLPGRSLLAPFFPPGPLVLKVLLLSLEPSSIPVWWGFLMKIARLNLILVNTTRKNKFLSILSLLKRMWVELARVFG